MMEWLGQNLDLVIHVFALVFLWLNLKKVVSTLCEDESLAMYLFGTILMIVILLT